MVIEKKGGYSGGRPASEIGPPAKVPSGSVKPCRGDHKWPPLRLAAATLREQSFDVNPAIPASVASPLAEWLDRVALSWEEAARLDPDALHYLATEPNSPSRVAKAIVRLLHG